MNHIQYCALCGYPTHGDFYVEIPWQFDNSVMHSIRCGPVLTGDKPIAPTHRRLDDGTFVRLAEASKWIPKSETVYTGFGENVDLPYELPDWMVEAAAKAVAEYRTALILAEADEHDELCECIGIGVVHAVLDAYAATTDPIGDLWKVAADSWLDQRTDLRAEVDDLRKTLERFKRAIRDCEPIVAERDAMLPVVEAAKAWRHSGSDPDVLALVAAVDALSTPPPGEGE